MTHQYDILEDLLAETDREFQPKSAVAACPHSQRISIRALQKRRARQVVQRAGITAAMVICGAMAVTWWSGAIGGDASNTSGADLAAASNRHETMGPPTIAIRESEYERAVAELERQAAFAAHAARTLQRELQLDALREEYRSLRRVPKQVETRSPRERAAQLSLNLAAELDRQSVDTKVALSEYQRIVDQFPETTSARAAQRRLAQADL